MAVYHHNATFGYSPRAARDSLQAVALSFFLVFFGQAVRAVSIRANWRGPLWVRSEGSLSLIALFLLCLAGWCAPSMPASPLPLLGLIGIAGAASALRTVRRRASWGSLLLLLAFAVLFAVRMAWFMLILLEDKLVQTGIQRDPLHHAALASMIQTYGIPSLGVNGVVYFPYHFGSHWVAAQLANLTGAPLLQFYEATFRIALIPLFLHTFLGFILTLRQHLYAALNASAPPLRADFIFGVVLFMGLIGAHHGLGTGVLPDFGSSLLGSESFVLAQACLYAVANACFAFFRSGPLAIDAPRARTFADWTFAALLLPASAALLGLMKISVLLVALPVLFYFLLRRRALPRALFGSWFVVTAAATVAVMAATRLWHSQPVSAGDPPITGFASGFLAAPWQASAALLSYVFWPALFVLTRFWQLALETPGDVVKALRRGRLLDVEMITLAALVGFAPASLARVQGGGEIYFTIIPITAGLALVCASRGLPLVAPPAILRALTRGRITGLLAFFAVLPYLVLMAREAMSPASGRPGVLRKVATTLFVVPIQCLGQDCTARRAEEQAQRVASHAAAYRVIQQLHELSAKPRREKAQTLLFVPATTRSYWQLNGETDANAPCQVRPLIGPAIAGVAMLDARPDPDCPGVVAGLYGMEGPPRVDDTTDAGLCSAAARRGFTELYVMDAGPDGVPFVRVLSCHE